MHPPAPPGDGDLAVGARDAEALVQAGRYADAALAFHRLGQLERAQKLYERVWQWAEAAEVARERGDRPALVRLLIEAKQPTEATREFHAVVRGVGGAPGSPAELTRLCEVFERRHLHAEAAETREKLGHLVEAHAHYLAAQLPLEAARLDETLGRSREAGVIYEQFVAGEAGTLDAARAHLRLGHLLSNFGQKEESLRHLQRAAAVASALATPDPNAPATQLLREARERLVAALAALGYRDGARAVLADRFAGERVPALDDFVAETVRRAHAETPEVRLGGRYSVVRLLGSGGMGRVYLARDAFTGRDVAVKVVAAPTDKRLQDGYFRFVREADVVSRLSHPNIVAVVQFHEELGLLAMEYMPGGTLADRLPRPLPPTQVRTLALQLAGALEAAHSHGVIHRDLKPANVFFSAAGEAKLGDFGVAHLQELGATQTAGFIGTLAYMSPEQISGAPLTFAADLYALGVTLFQALVGRLPFIGPDFVAQHLGDAPPRASSLRPGLAPAWDALLFRLLEKDPRARFATLEELRRALAELPVDGDQPAPARPDAPTPSEEAAVAQRYQVSGRWQAAPAEREVWSASDRQLGREVLIERWTADYADSAEGKRHLAWLRACARDASPHLQRLLTVERRAGGLDIVFEAPSGPLRPLASLSPPMRAALADALRPLHDAGLAHGALDTSIVVETFGELAVPVLLLAGRAPTSADADAERTQLAAPDA